MSELHYGFTDQNGILINTTVFDSDNLDIIETIKEHYQASNYYLIDNPISFSFIVGETYWNGNKFINPAPYPSWVWNEEINGWDAPVPYPTIEEGSDEQYIWDENTTSWLLIPPSN